MKKIMIIFIFLSIFMSVYADYKRELELLGYEFTEDHFREDNIRKKERKGEIRKSVFSGDIYDKTGMLSNSGLTGGLTLPSGYILRTGEMSVAYSYSYKDGIISYLGNLLDAKQYEKNIHFAFGVTQNIEAGFNFVDYFGEIATLEDQNVSLQTLNFKYSFESGGIVMALGGHYTDITPKDQLLMTYSVLEKANSMFFSLSEQINPFIKTSVIIKSSFIRSIKEISGFDLSGTSFSTAGMLIEYSRMEGVSYLLEWKKMNGDFTFGDNDSVINAGIRIKNGKIGSNLMIENITNSSDKIYGYSLNYIF
jgi:hypothetical protein